MKTSLLIPIYNQFALAQRCIMRLMETTSPDNVEIIAGDDASPEGNALDAIPPGVQAFRNPVNLGFAGNCNELAKRAKGDIIIFVNTDTTAHAGWLSPILRLLASPRVGIVGPKLLFPDGKLQSAGGWFDGAKGPFHRYLAQRGDWGPVMTSQRVSWTTGAVMATKRALFEELGGFDAVAYPRAYFEDVDYCMKVRQKGLEVWYCAESVFTHLVGQSTGQPKTYIEQLEAGDRFKRNSMTFHKRWNTMIVPDVQRVEVNY